MTKLETLINKMSSQPKSIFLIDALGALLSAFLLGIVLVKLKAFIGMPEQTLIYLALIPIAFAVYSFSCYFFMGKKWRTLLKIIAFANLGYCVLTFSMLFFHQSELTILGIAYFLIEIIIVAGLAFFEFKIAAK